MNRFKDYIYNLIKLWVPGNEEVAAKDEEDVAVHPSTSVKRGPEENTQEEMIKKRKKLIAPASSIIDGDPCLSSYLSKSTISDYQKENKQMASDNLNINQVLRRRQKSPRLKSPEIYLIDDDDWDLQVKRPDRISPGGMTLRSRNCSTNLEKSSSSDECIVVGETHRPYSRPSLVLRNVQSMREQSTLMQMFTKQCSISRKSTPLTNSTVHNTKLNRSVPNGTKTGSCIRRRSLNYPSLSPMTKSFSLTIEPCESAFDKTVITNVIDLTNEDDEDQRQAIESKVISSSEIRNLKSSFVADDQSFALDENLVTNLTQKYEAKLQNIQKRASKLTRDLASRKKEVAESISEILEKRLILKEHVAEKEDVVHKPSMEIAPITKEMISEMNSILATRKYPLVQIKDTAIKAEDIRTLENTSWLNDEVINAYMNLIKARSEDNPKKYPKVHCFNTFLYEQLSKKGYSSVRRWTRKVDIFDFEILIIPIHLGNHWCLTQIRFQEKIIYYYDSMGSPNNRCLHTMMQYLVEEYKDKKKDVFDSSNWTLKNVPYEELPQQKNAYDCGVFACTFAEHLTRNSPLNFDQDHMQYFRYKMMYEILTGKLLL